MILAVCADKGSPGVTTLALALGLVWPGDRLVLEADPSGADLPLRLERADGGPLGHQPNVLSLAADSRIGLPAGSMPRYAQQTRLGVPVIPGALSAEASSPMRTLWPAVAGEAARWHGTVIADLGRLQTGHTALPIAQAATAVMILARPTMEGLYHLRDRVYELAHQLGGQHHHSRPDRPSQQAGLGGLRTPVTVAVLSDPKHAADAAAHVTGMLDAMGAPVRVAGTISDDPRTVQALYAARLDRRAPKTPLLASAAALVGALTAAFPELNPAHHVDDYPPRHPTGQVDGTGVRAAVSRGIGTVDDGASATIHEARRHSGPDVTGGGLSRDATDGWSPLQAPRQPGARP